jgi:hypothetical protein
MFIISASVYHGHMVNTKGKRKAKGLKCSIVEHSIQVGLEMERTSNQELERRYLTDGLDGEGRV